MDALTEGVKPSSRRLPRVDVRGPGAEEAMTVEIEGERLTIGRLAGINDVVLQPDPQQLVSRTHCLIERDGGRWYVVDNASANGTLIRRGGSLERVRGRAALHDGDTVCALGLFSEAGEPAYFELVFTDPEKTRNVFPEEKLFFPEEVHEDRLVYDFAQARLFLVQGSARRALSLRPQAHKLVRYMVGRNMANGGVAVLCSRQELMDAVWGDDPLHLPEELARLFWELRKQFEPYTKEPLVDNERGLGYRLRGCAERAA